MPTWSLMSWWTRSPLEGRSPCMDSPTSKIWPWLMFFLPSFRGSTSWGASEVIANSSSYPTPNLSLLHGLSSCHVSGGCSVANGVSGLLRRVD